MDNYKQIVKSLTATEQEIYTSATDGMVIRTLMLNNTTSADVKATVKIDSVAFNFTVKAEENLIISTPILTKNLKVIGNGVSLHITGIEL